MKQQIRNANCEAMDCQRAFSWVNGDEVQAGVYLKYTQEYFHQYILPTALYRRLIGRL